MIIVSNVLWNIISKYKISFVNIHYQRLDSFIPLFVVHLCESQTVVISGQHLCANVVPIVDISADHKWSHTYVSLPLSQQFCDNR